MKIDSTLMKYGKLITLIADEFNMNCDTARTIVTDVIYDRNNAIKDYINNIEFEECDEELDDIEEMTDDSDEWDEWDDDSNECDDDQYNIEKYPEDIETIVNEYNKIRIPAAFMKAVFGNCDNIWEECSVLYHKNKHKISIGKTETFDYLFLKKNLGTIHIYSNRGSNSEWGFNLRILKSVDIANKWLTIHYNHDKNIIEITW